MTYWVVKWDELYLLNYRFDADTLWSTRREDAAKFVTREDAQETVDRLGDDSARVVRIRSRA